MVVFCDNNFINNLTWIRRSIKLPVVVAMLGLTLIFQSPLFSQSIDYSCIGSISLPPPMPPPYRGPVQPPPIVSRSGGQYKIPFDTIQFNSTLGTQAYDIVFVEDGVTNDVDIAGADNYVDSVIQRWQQTAQYKDRFKYFNIYRVAKYSKQRGASRGFYGDTVVNNRYGSTYWAYGLPRLILPENYDTLFADADYYVPQHDLVINLVYDPAYGGSGWDLYDGRKVASFGIDSASGWHLGDEVITHEMQHTMPFAGHTYLGDEYQDSVACSIYDTLPIAYHDSPNYTNDTVNGRKWQYCMGVSGVGFYDSAGICPGGYRPTYLCAMRSVFNIPNSDLYNLGMPAFCPVCRENSTAFFDSMINPVYNVSPSPGAFTGTYTYRVMIDTPANINTYRNQWFFDDSLIAIGTDSVNINFDEVSVLRNHALKFVCTDTDPAIIDTTLRRPWISTWAILIVPPDTDRPMANLHMPEPPWDILSIHGDTNYIRIPAWKVQPAGTTGGNAVNQLSVFPNPVSGRLNVVFNNTGMAFFQVMTPEGRLVGDYRTGQSTFSLDVSPLPAGVYFLVVQDASQKLVKRFVKQ